MDEVYFNLIDVYKTLKVNGLLDTKRVHGGTDNQDTVGGLLEDTFSQLFDEEIPDISMRASSAKKAMEVMGDG